MQFRELSRWSFAHSRLIVVAILICIDLALGAVLYRAEHRVFRVAFLNVGQGDAIFVEAPNGNQLLYDAGPPSGAALRELRKVMPFWDRSIDIAVLSHPDMDHIGGFGDIFRRYDVDLAVVSGASSDNGVHEEIEQLIETKSIDRLVAQRGMTISMGEGVEADILYPDHDTTNMETNSASIVLRLTYGSTTFLFSGDLPKSEERYIVGIEGDRLRAQVLKAGHHGSRTSSGEDWLRTVDPEIVVVSAGLDNRYGHPHKEVLALLEQLHIAALKTFAEGTIIFESNGTLLSRR